MNRNALSNTPKKNVHNRTKPANESNASRMKKPGLCYHLGRVSMVQDTRLHTKLRSRWFRKRPGMATIPGTLPAWDALGLVCEKGHATGRKQLSHPATSAAARVMSGTQVLRPIGP